MRTQTRARTNIHQDENVVQQIHAQKSLVTRTRAATKTTAVLGNKTHVSEAPAKKLDVKGKALGERVTQWFAVLRVDFTEPPGRRNTTTELRIIETLSGIIDFFAVK